MQMIANLAKKHNHNPKDNKLYWALQKGMPEDKVMEAAELWLTNEPDKWSEAVNLIFQYTSHYGNQYRNILRSMQQGMVIYLAKKMDRPTDSAMGKRNTVIRRTQTEV